MIKSIKLSLFVSALSLFLLACNEKSEAGSSNEVIQESALQVAQAETEPSVADDAMPTESADATAESSSGEGSVDEPSEEGSTDEGMGLNSEMLAELQQQCEELAVEEQVSDENKAVFIEDCMVNKTNELNSDTSSEAETTEAAEASASTEATEEATEATEEASDAAAETVKTE